MLLRNLPKRLKNRVHRLARDIVFRTGLGRRQLFRVYKFLYRPHQLEFLMNCLRETGHLSGACVEIGCAQGATTIFLKKYLDHLGSKRRYVAIDTFSGFVEGQADYELNVMKKDSRMVEEFSVNRREWVAYALSEAEVTGVELVEDDATRFDFSALGGISFCLLDIDLYGPILDVLPKVYAQLEEGGVIVVDDCIAGPSWDGALAAYEAFVTTNGMKREIVCDKLGVIRK